MPDLPTRPTAPDHVVPSRYLGLVGEQTVALGLALSRTTQQEEEAHRTIRATRAALAARVWRLRARARSVGLAAGRRASADAVEALIDQTRRYTEVVRAAERDCLELSVAIAAEIVEADLVPNTDLLARRIERALSELLDHRAPRFFVAETEVKRLREALPTVPPEAIQSDQSLAPGDAILETPAGSIRLVWREHLERIRERLFTRLNALPPHNTPE